MGSKVLENARSDDGWDRNIGWLYNNNIIHHECAWTTCSHLSKGLSSRWHHLNYRMSHNVVLEKGFQVLENPGKSRGISLFHRCRSPCIMLRLLSNYFQILSFVLYFIVKDFKSLFFLNFLRWSVSVGCSSFRRSSNLQTRWVSKFISCIPELALSECTQSLWRSISC